MPHELGPHQCVKEQFLGEFTPTKALTKNSFDHAPTPKLRMEVLKRDGYRCKICGRRPADYVDIELHVHHIRPYSERGVTTKKNLIALCHTCHKGLVPHHEPNLYELIDPHSGESGDELKRRMLREHIEGVECYRKSMRGKIEAYQKAGYSNDQS
jgi:hypothetical protein